MKHPFLVKKEQQGASADTLAQLEIGQWGRVTAVGGTPSMQQRLQDIGILEGTCIRCVGKSPLGDPSAYLIRGCVMALRQQDSELIFIQEVCP